MKNEIKLEIESVGTENITELLKNQNQLYFNLLARITEQVKQQNSTKY